jgi:hypothetical protein
VGVVLIETLEPPVKHRHPFTGIDDVRAPISLTNIDSLEEVPTIAGTRIFGLSKSWSDEKSVSKTLFGAPVASQFSRSFAAILRPNLAELYQIPFILAVTIALRTVECSCYHLSALGFVNLEYRGAPYSGELR